jgi:hypothetical protein
MLQHHDCRAPGRTWRLRFRTVNGSPCDTIKRLDDPKPVFFDSAKRHVPSNPISPTSPVTPGSGGPSPNSRAQRHISVWLLPDILPSAWSESFAIAQGRAHIAFFAATAALVRPSPSRRLHPRSLQWYRCFPPTAPFLAVCPDPHLLRAGTASVLHAQIYHKSIFI